MDGSKGAGFMAVFAVSGSIVLLSLQFHKRLLSDFMKKIEFELEKDQPKKKVRFSDNVVELSLENKEYLLKKNVSNSGVLITAQNLEVADKKMRNTMPLNWQILYQGIIEHRKNTANWTYKST
ncbi:hypothetical protein LguiB_003987 [Lonicera macranthoides]